MAATRDSSAKGGFCMSQQSIEKDSYRDSLVVHPFVIGLMAYICLFCSINVTIFSQGQNPPT